MTHFLNWKKSIFDATYVCDSDLKTVFEKLEHNSKLVIAWFETNYMQLNTDKYHLLNTSCED